MSGSPHPSPSRPQPATACAALALLLLLSAMAAGGVWWPDLSPGTHPLALPGATGVRGNAVYNALAFVVPGLLACVPASRFYDALPADAGWGVRIGARLLLVSALAWAAQGVFPLDLRELDGPAARLHATAWMCWWLAGAAGLLLVGSGLRALRIAAWTIAAIVCALAMWPDPPWPAGLSQRAAALLWATAWLAWAVRARRGSVLR